jgi:hypothetical protein
MARLQERLLSEEDCFFPYLPVSMGRLRLEAAVIFVCGGKNPSTWLYIPLDLPRNATRSGTCL